MEEDFGPGTKLLGVADWFQKKLGQSSAQPRGWRFRTEFGVMDCTCPRKNEMFVGKLKAMDIIGSLW